MRVRLKDLKSNPWRRRGVDPIDHDIVANLTKSIKAHGFWGGIVLRQVGDQIQIIAGQHGVLAAIKAGIEYADLNVNKDMSDADAVLIYAAENATQRGSSSTAGTGSVASATWLIAKAALSGHMPEISGIWSKKAMEVIRGNIASSKGLGVVPVHAFLESVPGLKRSSIDDYFANIKASGEYAKIIEEVKKEIESELAEDAKAAAAAKREEERAALEYERDKTPQAKKKKERTERESKKHEPTRRVLDTTKKAMDAAKEREPTFDYAGVSEWIEVPAHLNVFRKAVVKLTEDGYLKLNMQARLAREIVELSEKTGSELTGRFIIDVLNAMVLEAKTSVRNLESMEAKKQKDKSVEGRFAEHMDRFIEQVNSMMTTGLKIAEFVKDNPGTKMSYTAKYKSAVTHAKTILDRLHKQVETSER